MTRSPNFLILMADQLAPHYTGAYGHPTVQTPNLDSLVESGCRFDAAYTGSPICASGRYALLSGQLPFQIKAYDNATEFQSTIPTFCHYLRRMGYHTCLSGKMHFIGPDQLHGFSERLTTDIYPADYAFTPNWAADERIDAWYHNMSSVHEAGVADMTFQLEFDDEVGFHAIRKLYDYTRQRDNLPFAMVASFTHPHDPYVARPEWWNLYDHDKIDPPDLDLDSVDLDAHSQRLIEGMQADIDSPTHQSIQNARHAYYANVSYVDNWVGEFLKTLKRTNLLDNTIVIFTADHGEMLGERGLWYKMNFFEQSARVPLIVSGPGVVNTTVPNACSTIDLLPTLLQLASDGTDSVPELCTSIDGESLHSVITGSSECSKDYAISQYSAECAIAPMVMIRRGKYKFIHCESDKPLLFDLQKDPQELKNLACDPSHKNIVDSFAKEISEKWDLAEIRSDIIVNQQARIIVHEAMSDGTLTSWDYQPLRNAADEYVRNHRECDEMAAVGRYPPLVKSL